MKLLHLSDPHFGSNNYLVKPHKVQRGLIQFIREHLDDEPETFYLMITGDITSKGYEDGFKQAKFFFNEIIEQTKILKKNILICPGNHDICNNSFEDFDTFSYKLRSDRSFLFNESNNQLLLNDNICFLGINTAYHLNNKYGKIDLSGLDELLQSHASKISNINLKIAFFHHHILNILDDDNSAIKNSYNLMHLLSEYKFNAIFHGHQHAKQLFDINGINVYSISSLLDSRASSNLIGLYNLNTMGIEQKDEFVFCQDEMNQDGTRGRYRKLC